MIYKLLIGGGIAIITFVVFVSIQYRVRRKRNYMRRQVRHNRILIIRALRLDRRTRREITKSRKKRLDKQTVTVKGCLADATDQNKDN